ncbi:PilC/PilY family type IV pilus protein [Acinetobacter portensis]|uniref:PilC/PilY family type IV pilus protein n=1 Tax=Acinetobacter portensis TaxID=1839785 RepID=UPI0013CFACE9|nr:PilC/PilY family type IV pilus protein [Acinetobacter portensis]
MNKNVPKNKIRKIGSKIFVCALSASLMGVFTTAITHASDIEIYKNPTVKGKTIVMLALDYSYRMGLTDTGKNKTRLAILKQSLKEALEGVKDAKGNYTITPLPDTTIVGLSTLGTGPRHGKIVVAARALNDWVGLERQRQVLIREINAIKSESSTATSLLYAETVGYLLGNSMTYPVDISSVNNGVESGVHTKFDYITDLAIKSPLLGMGKYKSPMSQLSQEEQQCSAQGIFIFTDGVPTTITKEIAEPLYKNAVNDPSFSCNATETPAVYYSLKNVDAYYRGTGTDPAEIKEMGYATSSKLIDKIVVGNSGLKQDKYTDRSAWQCLGAMAKKIAFETQTNKRIYTAVVGFDPDFSENLANNCSEASGTTYAGFTNYQYCGSAAVTASSGYSNGLNIQNALSLGELGKGLTSKLHYPDAVGTSAVNIIPERGGYFDASNGESQPIVDALSKFVNSMNISFDTTSFGTYVVPTDSLSSTASSSVYAPQFQPQMSGSGSSVQSTQQLWLGNLKKYKLNHLGIMVDARNVALLAENGAVKPNTKDIWNSSNDDDGANATLGGVSSKLTIPSGGTVTLANVSNVSKINTRPLFTDAKVEKASTLNITANKLSQDNNLKQITTELVLDVNDVDWLKVGWQRSIYQPYLLSALGYQLNQDILKDEWFTTRWSWDLAKIKTLSTMQQMGGVLHSDPILVTTEAPVDQNGQILEELKDTSNIVKASRQDYIIFGTMQGLLHMVDKNTGQEVFSFLPFEIIDDPARKDALLDVSNLQKSTKHPYYGIDGAWTSFVDYEYIEEPLNTFYVSQKGTNQLSYMRKFKAKTANIYGGMRMGGQSYYALDVKNPTEPKFLFQIDPKNGVVKSATTGKTSPTANPALQAMGQSWSKPTLAKVRFNNVLRDVMIVGGGYDYDVYENLIARDAVKKDKGAGVYMFDAKTGELLWNARYGTNNTSSTEVKNINLEYSVVSQIKAFDRNADGLVDNLYFGDLGGQVFRIDLNNNYGVTTNSFGRIVRMADFSSQKQRFYEMPALSIHDESDAKFGVISIASGNRSFPTNISNTFDNRVYVLFDKELASQALFNNGFAPAVAMTENDLIDWGVISTANVGDLRTKTKRGWYYILRSTKESVNETMNTGTVKAFNGYAVAAYNDIYSDLYVSLFNTNHSSTQQPNSCTGGITGTSVVAKLCLPYGICGDTANSTNVTDKKKVAFVSKLIDGFTKVNTGGFNDGTRNLVTIVPSAGQNYQMTKVFKSRNWREVQ